LGVSLRKGATHLKKGHMYDITLSIYPEMVVFPGDPGFVREQICNVEKGDPCSLTSLSMGSHTGTHMDAPFHYLPAGLTVDQIPLEDLIGPAKVVEVQSDQKCILPEHLYDKDIEEGDRILFKTRNTLILDEEIFRQDYVYIDPETAKYLVDKKIKLVGIDYYSIDRFDSEDSLAHKIFLTADVLVLEGINLAGVPEGEYSLIALPLKIKGCDGSPIRAILMDK